MTLIMSGFSETPNILPRILEPPSHPTKILRVSLKSRIPRAWLTSIPELYQTHIPPHNAQTYPNVLQWNSFFWGGGGGARRGLWDPSSPTRDRTHALGIESAES